MCGIFGVLVKRDIMSSSLENIVKNLAKRSQARGNDAVGLAIINRETGESDVIKSNTDANHFVNSENFHSIFDGSNGNITIMGHCRKATKGGADNNDNNHPFISFPVIGCHNGTIDDSITDKTVKEYNIKRKNEVDSSVFFDAIARNVNNIAKLYREFNKVNNFAISYVNVKKPEVLNLCRDGCSQREIFYYENDDVFVYAQTKHILMGALDEITMPKCEELDDNVLMEIQNGKIEKYTFRYHSDEKSKVALLLALVREFLLDKGERAQIIKNVRQHGIDSYFMEEDGKSCK